MTREELKSDAWLAITNIAGGPGYYGRLNDSVVDFALHCVRRCAEIVEDAEVERIGGPWTREDDARATLRSAANAIREEFGLAGEAAN